MISCNFLIIDCIVRIVSQCIYKTPLNVGTVVVFFGLTNGVLALTWILSFQFTSHIVNYYHTLYFFLTVALLGSANLLLVTQTFLQAIIRVAPENEKKHLKYSSTALIGISSLFFVLWATCGLLVNLTAITFSTAVFTLITIVGSALFRVLIDCYYIYAHCRLLKNLIT
jgi:hypothetical protein